MELLLIMGTAFVCICCFILGGYIKLNFCTGIKCAKVNPICHLCRLICRRCKHDGIAILLHCHLQLTQEGLRALMRTLRTNIEPDLHIMRNIIDN